LRKAGLEVKQQHPLKVYDEDGTVIADLRARTIIDGDVSTQSDEPRREKWFRSAIELSHAPAMTSPD
jgi:hypothetical protein